jgi:MFS family permease
MEPSSPIFRYTLLLFNCLLTFGSYFCFDMPTVLESKIEDQVVALFTTEVSTWYTLFYTIYAWTNMCMALVAGVLVDRIGARRSGFLFLSLCLLGASLFALGASVLSWSGKTRYIVMFVGRFIFGLGGGSITIVQNAITAKWFKGKELAFAFGCTLTISRIGSVVNYDGTPAIFNTFEAAHPGHGLGITLWFGAGLVTLGYLAMLGIVLMERKAEGSPEYEAMMAGSGGGGGGNAKDAAAEKEELDESGNVRKRSCLADLRKMPATFWIVCLVITFFYNLVFPFQVTSTRINE